MKRCTQCGLPSEPELTFCPSCGSGLPDAQERVVVDGRYELEHVLGRGSMGVVYRALDLGLERTVALKIIVPEYASDEGAVARFRREAAALAAVRSEHVAQVYTFGPTDDSFFFTMEYVKGRNLDEVLARHVEARSTIPVHQAVAVLRQLAAGLDATHRAGLVHRDVKPANVVIEDGSGRPVLIDFGLAQWTDPRRRSRNTVQAGTPSYIAPEQALGGLIDHRTDQYAYACSAFEILTGHVPFEGDDPYEIIRQHIEEPPPKVSSLRKELARFDPIIMRAMSKKPDDRFESLAHLGDELDRVAGPWFRSDLRALAQDPVETQKKPRGTRVLVAEHSEALAKTLGRGAQVAFFGVRISLSTSHMVDEAIDSARRVSPQIVILGHDPPAFDGLAVLRMLRSLPASSTSAVILVADDNGGAARDTILRLGVTEILPRNVPLPVLAETVQRVAASKNLLGGGHDRESTASSSTS